MGIHPSVDLYAIIGFGAIQCFFLGVRKMLKECKVVMLGDESKMSSAVSCANKKNGTFQVTKVNYPFNIDHFFITVLGKVFCLRNKGWLLKISEHRKTYRAVHWLWTAWYARGHRLCCDRQRVSFPRRQSWKCVWPLSYRRSDESFNRAWRPSQHFV